MHRLIKATRYLSFDICHSIIQAPPATLEITRHVLKTIDHGCLQNSLLMEYHDTEKNFDFPKHFER